MATRRGRRGRRSGRRDFRSAERILEMGSVEGKSPFEKIVVARMTSAALH